MEDKIRQQKIKAFIMGGVAYLLGTILYDRGTVLLSYMPGIYLFYGLLCIHQIFL
ncbi:MAG TPA: hypothetical protein GXX53_03160 [Tissierellia bacterium]|nr:hypothetical protein [Tissierellia bacterium]